MKTPIPALTLALLATTLVAPGIATARVAAPHVRAQSFEKLAKPLPLPYVEGANANAVVTAAKARALRGHKRLLIDLGGN